VNKDTPSIENDTGSLAAYEKFLKNIKPFSDKIEKIRKEYHFTEKDSFNIFTAISDQYKKENMHSDILKILLKNRDYLNVFLELLKKRPMENKKYFSGIEFTDDTEVKREEDRIDISIYDGQNGIIIENKINYAEDQYEQLTRYYNSLSKKKNIPVVVYIPPITNNNKRPPDNPKKVYDRLLILPVIDKDKKDIVHGFLDKIAKNEQNETMRVFIKQYSDLLKDWGEKIMIEDKREELLKKLFEKNNVAMTYNIIDVINNLEIHGEIIGKELKKTLGFSKRKDKINGYEKKIRVNGDEIRIFFDIFEKNCCLCLWSENERWKANFKKLLNGKDFKDDFSEIKTGRTKWEGIWKQISYLNLKDKHTIQEEIDFVMDKVRLLEKKCRQLKNT
jgi:hypothetical protein